MRVIVTGSRSWDRKDVVWAALDILATEAAKVGDDVLVVAHGACWPQRDDETGLLPERSADYLADLWVRRGDHPLPVRRDAMPADWRRYPRAAGHMRNRVLVASGADVVLAFIRNNSPGTRDCIRLAEKAEIPVQVIDYDDIPAVEEVSP